MVICVILAMVAILALALLWANGVDKMKKDHPDYKGEDFLS